MSDKGVNVSVIASRDKIGQAKFALDSAAKIMDFYDSFFGVKYPLPKQGTCTYDTPIINGYLVSNSE